MCIVQCGHYDDIDGGDVCDDVGDDVPGQPFTSLSTC